MSAVDQEASHEETNGRGAELSSENTLQLILSHLHLLKEDDLQQLSERATAEVCIKRQQAHLEAFAETFPASIAKELATAQPELLKSFLDMVAGMRVESSEQPLDSCSSQEGTLTISLPNLPDGVAVTRSRDAFFVDEGSTMLERNEVRVRLAGIGVYSGYWLAVDTPSRHIEDPLQEEGLDTLKRVMEAAGICFTEELYEDALEYPFLSALLAPFGPDAILPFEGHLRALHKDCTPRHGGCWYKTARKKSLVLEAGGVEAGSIEVDGVAVDGSLDNIQEESKAPRRLTEAEEAELEIDRLAL